MTIYTVRPPLVVRRVDPNEGPPEGLTSVWRGDGVLWIHVDGLARRIDLDPRASLVVGSALLKFAARHVALDEAEAAGSAVGRLYGNPPPDRRSGDEVFCGFAEKVSCVRKGKACGIY